MNMNKVLVAGLTAAIAITAAPEASADVCGNGGFYIGVNAGMAIARTKTKTTARTHAKGDSYLGIKIGEDGGDGAPQIDDGDDLKALNSENGIVAKSMKVKKTKTRFMAELVFGYDWRMNDVMMGVDLTFGNAFGKVSLKSKKEGEGERLFDNGPNPQRTFAKLKNQWHIALMPRVGYLFTPQFEGYITAGVKLTRFKLETYQYADSDAESAQSLAAAFGDENEQFPIEALTADHLAEAGKYSHKLKKSKCRFVPVIGAGVRYEITPEMFAKLEYNYEFRTNVKAHKDSFQDNLSSFKVRTQAHVVKLGFGYRF